MDEQKSQFAKVSRVPLFPFVNKNVSQYEFLYVFLEIPSSHVKLILPEANYVLFL